MMRNLLRFDLVTSIAGDTVIALNMDEISSISNDGAGDSRVRMTNGDEWIVAGSPEGTMDLVADITDQQEGRAL